MELTQEYLDQKFTEFDEKLDEKLDKKLGAMEKRIEGNIHDAVDQLALIIDRSVAQPMERHFAAIKTHQRR